MLRYGPDIFAVPCFHQRDPDSLFSGFGTIPKNPTESGPLLLFESAV